VTHSYIKTAGRSLLRSSRVASAAGRLRPNEVVAEVGTKTHFSGLQDFTGSWRIQVFT